MASEMPTGPAPINGLELDKNESKRLAGIRRTLPAVFSLTIPNKSQSRIEARPHSPFRCRPSPEPNERLLLDGNRLRDIDGRYRRFCSSLLCKPPPDPRVGLAEP